MLQKIRYVAFGGKSGISVKRGKGVTGWHLFAPVGIVGQSARCPMPVIAVVQEKGGSGKSTVAVHLARGLQLTGSKVLVVDADPQRSALDWYESQDAVTMPLTVPFTGRDLVREVERVQSDFDFVVIDTPPRVEVLMADAIRAADLTLIPTQHSAFDLRPAATVVTLFKAARKAKRTKRGAFVVNAVTASSRLAGEIDEALTGYGLPILSARLTNRVGYKASTSEGLTVFEMKDRRAKAEVTALVAEVRSLLQ